VPSGDKFENQLSKFSTTCDNWGHQFWPSSVNMHKILVKFFKNYKLQLSQYQPLSELPPLQLLQQQLQ